MKTIQTAILAAFVMCAARITLPAAETASLQIGWAATDITPPETSVIGGMPWARMSTGTLDPLTATVLVLESICAESPAEAVILVSCDLRSIRDELRDGLRTQLAETLPEMDPLRVILNATHTHSAPPMGEFGIDLAGMGEEAYQAFAIPRIVAAIATAWERRRPGGISFGLAHAVVGRNRLVVNTHHRSAMYGRTHLPAFSHIEGYEDPSVNLLYTWDREQQLTGIVMNIAAPSQISRGSTQFSADFWHDTRERLRQHHGEDLFFLPQCSAAGDQDTNVLWDRKAHERMLRLTGRNLRQEIAVRLTDAATSILPLMQENIDWNPALAHRTRILPLPRRMLNKQDVSRALAAATSNWETYERMQAELAEDPERSQDPQWVRAITQAFWHARRGQRVAERFELQQTDPLYPVEVHAIRLGAVAFVTNPFELYLDYGIQLKSRSPAVQTFVVQLAGSGSYAPTQRSVDGGGYGAVPASTQIGPDGANMLVTETLSMLDELWP